MEKLYIVVRADLKPGLQLAQACHALREFAARHPDLDTAWYRGSNNLVVLQVANEVALKGLMETVLSETPNTCCADFREIDLGNQLTAVAFEDGARKFVSSLPLALRQRADYGSMDCAD